MIASFKVPKPVDFLSLITMPEHQFSHLQPDLEHQKDRFLIVFKKGDSELFEWENKGLKLVHIESDKTKDHDC
jgi:hypothetical protein